MSGDHATARRLMLACATLAAIGAVAAVTPIGEAVSAIGSRLTAQPEPPAPAGPAEAGPPPAVLDPGQIAKAGRIAMSDRAVRPLVAGHGAAVKQVLPWTAPDERTVLGAVVLISLRDAISIERDLPSIAFPERGSSRYREARTRFVARAVDELMVWVDFAREAAVAVQPGENARVLSPKPALAPPGERQQPPTEGE